MRVALRPASGRCSLTHSRSSCGFIGLDPCRTVFTVTTSCEPYDMISSRPCLARLRKLNQINIRPVKLCKLNKKSTCRIFSVHTTHLGTWIQDAFANFGFFKVPSLFDLWKRNRWPAHQEITLARRRTVMTSPESVLSSVVSTTSMHLLLHQTLCDTPLFEWENTGMCSTKLVM